MGRWRIFQLDDAYDAFWRDVNPGQQRALDAYLDLLCERGNMLSAEGGKSPPMIGHGNLFELHPQNMRVFYCFLPDRAIVILFGVLKDQRKLRKEIIARVVGLRDEVLRLGTPEWQRLSPLN